MNSSDNTRNIDATPRTESEVASLRGERIHFLDEVRGFSVILMVFFHAFVTLGFNLNFKFALKLYYFFLPLQPFFAAIFILLCGISCWLSRNNVKRGLLLACVSAAISVVLYIFAPSEAIWFGILHFLSISILLFALLKKPLGKVPPLVGIILCAVLFVLYYNVSPSESFFGIKGLFEVAIPASWQANKLLFPIGFSYIKTADYFPLLPWFFCFLAGSFIGVWAKEGKLPKWMNKSRVPLLSFIGKKTFIIYVAHQPIIFAIGLLIKLIIK